MVARPSAPPGSTSAGPDGTARSRAAAQGRIVRSSSRERNKPQSDETIPLRMKIAGVISWNMFILQQFLLPKYYEEIFKEYFVFTMTDKIFVKASLSPGNSHHQG